MGRIFLVPFEGEARPEFGSDGDLQQPLIRTISVDLSVVRDKQELEIGGNFIWCAEATDNAANISVSFARETADQGITFKSGTRISGIAFSRVFLTNAAQSGKTLTISYSSDPLLQIDNPAGDFSSVELTKPTTAGSNVDQSLAAATTATVKAATPTRRRLVVEADLDNTVDLYVGPTVSDTQGLRLTPGAQMEFFTTVAISIRNKTASGASANWRYFEELD